MKKVSSSTTPSLSLQIFCFLNGHCSYWQTAVIYLSTSTGVKPSGVGVLTQLPGFFLQIDWVLIVGHIPLDLSCTVCLIGNLIMLLILAIILCSIQYTQSVKEKKHWEERSSANNWWSLQVLHLLAFNVPYLSVLQFWTGICILLFQKDAEHTVDRFFNKGTEWFR